MRKLLLILPLLYIINTMNANPPNIADQQARSKIDNSSQKSLTSKIEYLKKSSDWWNKGYLLFVAIAVIIGGFTAYWQYTAVKKARELADTEAQLSRFKESALLKDLKGKDEKIAELDKQAESLKAEAEKSKEGIAIAQTEAAKAQQKAAEANIIAEGFKLDIAQANERAAEANRIAEKERIDRLRLEAQIAPRRLSVSQQRAITSACSRFAVRSIRVESYSLDSESAILAKQIVNSLRSAEINVTDDTASVMSMGGFMLGVHVNGNSHDIVFEISSILTSIGNLIVAAPNSVQNPGPAIISAPNPNAVLPFEATIFVGIKPIQ
jgi:hypothetical protein